MKDKAHAQKHNAASGSIKFRTSMQGHYLHTAMPKYTDHSRSGKSTMSVQESFRVLLLRRAKTTKKEAEIMLMAIKLQFSKKYS